MKKSWILLLIPLLIGASQAITLKTSIQMDEKVFLPGELVSVVVDVENIAEDKIYFLDYWVDQHYILNARVLEKGNNKVKLFFNAPQEPGFHTIKVKIYDGKYYSITKQEEFVVASESKGFLIELQPKVTITGDKTNLTLKIANMGTYKDLFEVLPPNYYTLWNHSYVEVDSHDIEYLDIEVDFSEYRSSNYNFPIKVCSLHLWSCLTNNAEILVKRDESKETIVDLSGQEFLAYPGDRVYVNIYLNNTSQFNKSYSLLMEPVNFSGEFPQRKLISLEGGKDGRIRVAVQPNSTGQFSLRYTLLSNGVEIKTGLMNITSLQSPLTAAAIFSAKYGWIYAIVALAIILVLSYLFVGQGKGKIRYPYFK